jgi:RNA polymerase sigma-70 factor (ECF subfamily)
VPSAPPYNTPVMTEQQRDRFDGFVRVTRAPMLRIAQNLCRNNGRDPEDLVHEALERVLWQLERGGGPDPLTLPFVSTVMTNRHIDLCRRKKAEDTLVTAAPESVEEASTPDPEDLERWRGVSDERLVEAILTLHPKRIREAYEMHAKGLRYRQIAEKLGIPEGTVGSDLSEARKQLRKFLSNGGRGHGDGRD